MSHSTLERPASIDTDPTSAEAQRRYILEQTNWVALFEDVVTPPAGDEDEYYAWLKNGVPNLLDAMLRKPDDRALQDLAHIQTILVEHGYIDLEAPRQNSMRRPQHVNPEPLKTYVKDWLAYTDLASIYMRGKRAELAKHLPTEQLRPLLEIAAQAEMSANSDTPPHQIQDALRHVASSIMTDYELKVAAEEHAAFEDLEIANSELLHEYLTPEELLQTTIEVQHSFPPHLMRGLKKIDAKEESSINTAHTAEAWTEVGILYVFKKAIATGPYVKKLVEDGHTSQAAFKQVLTEVLYHEFAHFAHTNAPSAWLRSWEKLQKIQPLTITDYARDKQNERPREGRVEDFAEAVRAYFSNPLGLAHRSWQHFILLDELIGSYSWEAANAAADLYRYGRTTYSTDPQFKSVQELLETSRQSILNERLAATKNHTSPLGRVSLAATQSKSASS